MSEKHARRYPKHKGDKGQIHGGVCNRTSCHHRRAVWWNVSTLGFYCSDCARGINEAGDTLCFPLGRKPRLAEMDAPDHGGTIARESEHFRIAQMSAQRRKAAFASPA